jgi:hypothetical protein
MALKEQRNFNMTIEPMGNRKRSPSPQNEIRFTYVNTTKDETIFRLYPRPQQYSTLFRTKT